MSTLISRDCSRQYLIEARLDTIERFLMENRVSRSERSEIVCAVEEQIGELLETMEGEITREKVLRVLATLDPPEAYCGDEPPRDWPVRRRLSASGDISGEGLGELPGQRLRERRLAPLAIAALVFSLISIPAIIIMPLGSILALAGAICGVIAVNQIAASHGRLRGLWMAIVGFVMLALQFAAVWGLVLLR